MQWKSEIVLQAHKVCPSDPLACNELGVLTYRNQQYSASEQWLLRALELVPGRLNAGKPTCCIHVVSTVHGPFTVLYFILNCSISSYIVTRTVEGLLQDSDVCPTLLCLHCFELGMCQSYTANACMQTQNEGVQTFAVSLTCLVIPLDLLVWYAVYMFCSRHVTEQA